MKLTTILLLITINATGQYAEHESDINNAASFFVRGGYGKSPQIAAGAVFRMHNIGMGAELNIPWADDAAKEFGARLSYKFGAMEIGYGRYILLITTDKYDQDKNGFGNMAFIAYHRNVLRQNWFVEADYMNGFRFTLGVNGLISKLK